MATLDCSRHAVPVPHRKPLPGPAYPSGMNITNNDQIYNRQPSHSHTRTASSVLIPGQGYPTQQQYPSPQQQYTQNMSQQPLQQTRRTPSNATSSTASSSSPNGANNLARAPTNPSITSSIRRSTSSRGSSSTSYVALMRKQKATVWCDRAQHEDPRLLAQQRAAKVRAAIEVVGGSGTSGHRTVATSSGGVRSKIRHHGAVKASAYTGNPNLSGVGVPMRLSASEVDEGDSDEERGYDSGARYHQRNGSGRSSMGSAQRLTSHAPSASQSSYAPPHHASNGSTPPSGASYSPSGSIQPSPEDPGETPVQDTYNSQQDYFEQPGSGVAKSTGSGSSEERGFGDVPGLPQRAQGHQVQKTNNDDLRRRGSVDDRTMTMSGVRLFIANPDLSD